MMRWTCDRAQPHLATYQDRRLARGVQRPDAAVPVVGAGHRLILAPS